MPNYAIRDANGRDVGELEAKDLAAAMKKADKIHISESPLPAQDENFTPAGLHVRRVQ